MRIIQNNFNEGFPKQTTCIHCNSVLEYDEVDITAHAELVGNFGQAKAVHGITCPCCHLFSTVSSPSIHIPVAQNGGFVSDFDGENEIHMRKLPILDDPFKSENHS